jgi:transposase-like protein
MSKKSVAKPRSSPVQPAVKKASEKSRTRRTFTDEFRREAVAMLLDGHSATRATSTALIPTGSTNPEPR